MLELLYENVSVDSEWQIKWCWKKKYVKEFYVVWNRVTVHAQISNLEYKLLWVNEGKIVVFKRDVILDVEFVASVGILMCSSGSDSDLSIPRSLASLMTSWFFIIDNILVSDDLVQDWTIVLKKIFSDVYDLYLT